MTWWPVAFSLLLMLPEAQWASPIWDDPMVLEHPSPTEPWQGPVAGRVSSGFGVRRHPLSGVRHYHRGIDIAARLGNTVRAVRMGRVSFVGWRGGYGRMIEVVHGRGWHSRYAHLGTIAVQAGERVRAGAQLGTVGMSGVVTGPHLHLEIDYEGVAIDPLTLLRASAAPTHSLPSPPPLPPRPGVERWLHRVVVGSLR